MDKIIKSEIRKDFDLSVKERIRMKKKEKVCFNKNHTMQEKENTCFLAMAFRLCRESCCWFYVVYSQYYKNVILNGNVQITPW